MLSKKFFIFFVVVFLGFTLMNYKIHTSVKPKPKPEDTAIRQDSGDYAMVLHKLQTSCTGLKDEEKNTFYTCEDGSRVTVIHWIRGEKQGYVTRNYDKSGKLLSMYGHPDDR